MDDSDYKPLSRLALGSIGLGAAGLLSLLSPALVLIPLAGALVSAYSIWRVRRAPVTGGRLAVWALAISCFCLTSVAAHSFGHRSLLKMSARLKSEQWLSLVAVGRLFEAHQLMTAQEERLPEAADLPYHYRLKTPEEVEASRGEDGRTSYPLGELNKAFEAPPLKQVAAALQRGDQPVFLGTAQVNYEEHHQYVYSLFRLPHAGLEFAVGMRRDRDRHTRETRWQVRAVTERR